MMNEGYFVGRKELTSWIREQFDGGFQKVPMRVRPPRRAGPQPAPRSPSANAPSVLPL